MNDQFIRYRYWGAYNTITVAISHQYPLSPQAFFAWQTQSGYFNGSSFIARKIQGSHQFRQINDASINSIIIDCEIIALKINVIV